MTNREQQAGDVLQNIANDIKKRLPEDMGFTLLAYEFGTGENKRMFYVSNSNREDVIKAMIEFIQKNIDDPEMFGKDV